MGRIFGFMGILCLILIGVSSRFPYLFRELTAAVERGRFELTEPNRKKFLAKNPAGSQSAQNSTFLETDVD